MAKNYKLRPDLMDLTFDDMDVPMDDENSEISEKLSPTEAMNSCFIQNCVDEGILILA